MSPSPAGIPPGGFKELGPVNWVIAKVGARGIRRPRFSLMNVLGQHRLLFPVWLPLSAYLLYAGKLSRRDAETVILRVGHLRDCEYELQQHRRLARSRGLDAAFQAKVFEGPDAEGLTERERVLITATDEFVVTKILYRMQSRDQLDETKEEVSCSPCTFSADAACGTLQQSHQM